MTTLRFILGDQLSREISSLTDATKNDIIFLCEVMEEATYVQHHQQKLAFIFAAMRHFASDLKKAGYAVHYTKLNDSKNLGSFTKELARMIQDHKITQVIITEASEYRVQQAIKKWSKLFNIPVDIRQDTRFLCSIDEFSKWAGHKKQLRMEFFYREMRRKYNILLDPKKNPVGGKWNYDAENRNPPRQGLSFPKRMQFKHTKIVQEVLHEVAKNFKDNFGDLKFFNYAVDRKQALKALKYFIENFLPKFGDYQDAMLLNEVYLNHSAISFYINIGLLLPLEVCLQAEQAYLQHKAPLHSVEGFIRQILGWREFIRGVYWLKMPGYAKLNYLDANLSLPKFYWDGNTDLACLAEVVKQTHDHAYSHHIQRLMITGNFALIAGINVHEVHEWYLAVYADAYEWVEMPNTLGMALYADHGIVGSKPYAASGKYINKMSNFCKSCKYDPNELLAENACPFNALYWDFHARNIDKLSTNNRLTYVYSTWKKFSTEKQHAIRSKAKKILLGRWEQLSTRPK